MSRYLKKSLWSHLSSLLGKDNSSITTMVTRTLSSMSYKSADLKQGLGYQQCKCYLVGGAVRDILKGKVPRDFDFATDASPSTILAVLNNFTWGDSQVVETRNYFEEIDLDGKVISKIDEVKVYKDLNESDSLDLRVYRPMVSAKVYNKVNQTYWNWEIACYQIYQPPLIDDRGNYTSKTLMVKSLEEHLTNADFTINSLAVDKEGRIVDLFEGIQDVKNGVLTTIGDAQELFKTQPRTILRAIKLLSSGDYKLDSKTEKALKNAIFEEDIPVRANIKRQIISEILTKSSGIKLLNKYGVTQQMYAEYDAEITKDDLKRITKGFNNLQKYMKPASHSEVDIQKDSIYILLLYFISQSYDIENIDDKSIELSKKDSISPKYAKSINHWSYFRPSELLKKQQIIIFRAVEKYLDINIPSDLYSVKEELDSFFLDSNSMLTPSDLLRCFNSIIIPIALDSGQSIEKIFSKNRFLFNLYSAKYENLMKYNTKAIKHIMSYYSVTEEKATTISRDLVSNCLIDKNIPATWEYLLTNLSNNKKYKLSSIADIKSLSGQLENKRDYSTSLERIITEHSFEDVSDSKIDKNMAWQHSTDYKDYIDWYEDFVSEIEDWEDKQVDQIEYYRKIINLLIFNWQIKIIPDGKVNLISGWVNNWFSYTLDSMIFNSFDIISKNRDIKNLRSHITDKMSKEDLKIYDKLAYEYDRYMSYGHSIWNDNLTNTVSNTLNKARDKVIQLIKDEGAYSEFFPNNIVVDNDGTTISELVENNNKGTDIQYCPKCNGVDFMEYKSMQGDLILKCISKDCYVEIDTSKHFKYYTTDMNPRQLDWIIFYDNTYIHRPIVSNIYERLQLTSDKETRKTLNNCKNEYNSQMFQVHKNYNENNYVVDGEDSNSGESKSTKFLDTYRRMALDNSITQIRNQLIKKGVFDKADFKGKIANDVIYTESLIFDWILFNTENSYKLTKIDLLRSLFNSAIRYLGKSKEFLPIQREYYDKMENPDNWDMLYGRFYTNISMDYFKDIQSEIRDEDKMIDTTYWKTHRSIYKLLNDETWFGEYHHEGVVPTFYCKRKWFDLETSIMDNDNEIKVMNELTTIIYSILEIHKPTSWGALAKIYNELPLEKMEFGLLTANLAKYIYDKCIKPYK